MTTVPHMVTHNTYAYLSSYMAVREHRNNRPNNRHPRELIVAQMIPVASTAVTAVFVPSSTSPSTTCSIILSSSQRIIFLKFCVIILQAYISFQVNASKIIPVLSSFKHIMRMHVDILYLTKISTRVFVKIGMYRIFYSYSIRSEQWAEQCIPIRPNRTTKIDRIRIVIVR